MKSRWSSTTTSIAVAGFGLGVLTGGLQARSSPRTGVEHVPGTEAWGVHIALTVFALAWIALAVRFPRARPPLPLSTGFAGRIRAVYRRPLRAVVVTALLLMDWYLLWRMGEQVLAGIDPGFTANAWGGPGYPGALYCHYLDAALIIAATLLAIDRLVPRAPRIPPPEADLRRAESSSGAGVSTPNHRAGHSPERP